MKKIYIAHPFTTHGDPEENFSKQVSLCQRVFRLGHIPVSPILTFGRCIPHDKEHYQMAMDACFWLLRACDEVWFFGEWEKSKGCKLEYDFAKSLGIPCHSDLPDGTIWFSELVSGNEDTQLPPDSSSTSKDGDLSAVKEYVKALEELLKYRSHYSWCAVGNTEFCTCGMREVVNKARALVNQGTRAVQGQ